MYQYQVSFGDAISRACNKYCCFTGRASRSEYWWFVLFVAIVGWGIGIVFGLTFGTDSFAYQTIAGVWNLAVLLPTLGLVFRRLHDTGRSGWNWCWSFLPVVGWIILLIYLCQDSQMVENKYGPVPNLRY
ncbi:MAG: DUF805 domain-containing protein [Muribaculaceae bacterium]|nr:DUF805 domain-containing protein [Muribaculaceae bacterium]